MTSEISQQARKHAIACNPDLHMVGMGNFGLAIAMLVDDSSTHARYLPSLVTCKPLAARSLGSWRTSAEPQQPLHTTQYVSNMIFLLPNHGLFISIYGVLGRCNMRSAHARLTTNGFPLNHPRYARNQSLAAGLAAVASTSHIARQLCRRKVGIKLYVVRQ